MNWWKNALARIAMHYSESFRFVKAHKLLEREIEETRTDSEDRAYLATKRGQLDQPPYASLRQ